MHSCSIMFVHFRILINYFIHACHNSRRTRTAYILVEILLDADLFLFIDPPTQSLTWCCHLSLPVLILLLTFWRFPLSTYIASRLNLGKILVMYSFQRLVYFLQSRLTQFKVPGAFYQCLDTITRACPIPTSSHAFVSCLPSLFECKLRCFRPNPLKWIPWYHPKICLALSPWTTFLSILCRR